MNVRIDALIALNMLFSTLSEEIGSSRDCLVAKLPIICETFLKHLQTATNSVEDYSFKTNIFKILCLLMNEFTNHMAPFVNSILPTVWRLVMMYGDVYNKYVANNDLELIMETDNEDGTDLTLLTFLTDLILTYCDTVSNIICQTSYIFFFDFR